MLVFPIQCIFMTVSNHGIPDETFTDVLTAMKTFYGQPLEKKMEVNLCSQ